MSASQSSTEKDQATGSKKADDKSTADSKAQDKPTADSKAQDKPMAESKSSDKATAESKAPDKPAAESKGDDKPTAVKKSEDRKSGDGASAEAKGAEDKPSDTAAKSADDKPAAEGKGDSKPDAAESKKSDPPELAAVNEKAPEPAAESEPDSAEAASSTADEEPAADKKPAVAIARAEAKAAGTPAEPAQAPAPKPAATPAPKPAAAPARQASIPGAGSTRTVGINLSAAAKFTTLVAIDWSDGAAYVSEAIVDLEDDELIGYLSSGNYTGVYAPFGWPVAMVEAVSSYTNSDQWQRASRREFRHRQTEGFVHDVLQADADQELWPQSVSCDRLALQARRMAQLREQLFTETGSRFDRAGADHIVEVYPPGASLLWGMGNHLGNGNGKLPAVDDKPGKEFIERVEKAAPWLQWKDGKRGLCLKNEHTSDALLAALVARAAELNLTHRPEAGDLDLARREGWMHLPSKDSLAALAAT